MCRPFLLLGESHGVARVGISRVFGLCAALLFASSVTASTIDVGPSDWRNYGPSGSHTGQGVRSSFGQNVRLPPTISGPTRVLPVSRNAVIPYGSIANGARNFLRVNPQSVAASAAITGLFLAVDWAWDELTQEWVKYELECPVGAICGIDGDFSIGTMCSNTDYGITGFGEVKTVTASSHFTMGGVSYPAGTVVSLEVIPDPNNDAGGDGRIQKCVRRDGGAPNWPTENGQFPVLVGTIITEVEEPVQVPTPVDFGELTAYLPSASPQDVADAASDIQTRIGDPLPGYQDQAITGPSSVTGPTSTSTSTDPVTGDTTVTETSTQTYIEYGDTTITTTNTTTSTSYQNGQETETTVTTETPGELPVSSGGGASGDWPGFCEWASVVCDWFNWTQEEPPPEQDLPAVIDDDFYQEKTISFGAKSCPPDHQIDLAPFLSTSVAVSFQPLCDFAGLIYYMVMAASYIIAAYITIGVARNG